MELYYVVSILDRNRRQAMERVYTSLGLKMSLTMLGRGTATREHLLISRMTGVEKAVMATVADGETTHRLIRRAEEQLYIDIPGNGIMITIPIKSAGGISTLAYLTDQKPGDGKKPEMKFDYELIYVILNEGHSDEVMNAARPAGAAGGTVLSAKGTGIRQQEKFQGLTLADEKEVILIVAKASKKAAIMQAIIAQAGTHTRAGAVCFSLPVSQVAGLRRLEEEDETPAAQEAAAPAVSSGEAKGTQAIAESQSAPASQDAPYTDEKERDQ